MLRRAAVAFSLDWAATARGIRHRASSRGAPVQLENLILTSEAWLEACTMVPLPGTNSSACLPPTSPLVFFFGPPLPDVGFVERQLTQDGIDAVLGTAAGSLYEYGAFFDKGFAPGRLSSAWTRSFYYFGLPRPGFVSAESQCAPAAPFKVLDIAWARGQSDWQRDSRI